MSRQHIPVKSSTITYIQICLTEASYTFSCSVSVPINQNGLKIEGSPTSIKISKYGLTVFWEEDNSILVWFNIIILLSKYLYCNTICVMNMWDNEPNMCSNENCKTDLMKSVDSSKEKQIKPCRRVSVHFKSICLHTISKTRKVKHQTGYQFFKT